LGSSCPFSRRANITTPSSELNKPQAGETPKDIFKELPQKEYEKLKEEQWQEVKDLAQNDPLKILYFQRFSNEWKSSTNFNPELTSIGENPFRNYVVDAKKLTR
jgi:uncharacterized membrane protein YheB (UPF0754 family)